MGREVELKLSVAPRDVGRLAWRLSRLAGRPRRARLLSRYYDTPDGALRRHGLALRLRREDGRWLQTLKGGGRVTGGLHRRFEFDRALKGPHPDLAAARRALPDLPWQAWEGRLTPVFETRFLRRRWRLAWGKADIEAALDQGEVRAGGKRALLCELELELLRGDPRALFDLAAWLERFVALVPDAVSKAEKGWHLAARQRTS